VTWANVGSIFPSRVGWAIDHSSPNSRSQKFEHAERVPYREWWAKLLARVYLRRGWACLPSLPGRLRPFGAVLPPHAAEWVRRDQFVAVESTGPPSRQEPLPFAS
jgi:hypothetical protein